MITTTHSLTISTSDGLSGSSPQTKSVTGLSFAGKVNQYLQSQTIGVAAPAGLSAVVSNSGGALAANTYYYVVTALNGTGGTGETTVSNEFTATTTGSASAVLLSWNAAPGATSYRVYRGTVSEGESVYFSVTGGATTFTDTGAWASGSVPVSNTTQLSAPGTVTPTGSTSGGTLAANTYYYKVTALNGAGETTGSPEASVTTTGSTSSVALAWAAVTGATSYRIYRGTSAGSENVYYASATNSFTDTGASATSGSVPGSNTTQVSAPGTITAIGSQNGGSLTATTYYYKVTALDGAGETTGSSEANVTVSGSTGSVSLTWAAVAGATSYKVYRGTSAGAENFVTPSPSNSFLDTNMPATSGSAPTSNTTGTTFTPTLAATPLQAFYLRNLSGANNATVAWTPNGGSSNTVLTLAPMGEISFMEPVAVTGGGITALTVTVSAPGTTIEGNWTA